MSLTITKLNHRRKSVSAQTSAEIIQTAARSHSQERPEIPSEYDIIINNQEQDNEDIEVCEFVEQQQQQSQSSLPPPNEDLFERPLQETTAIIEAPQSPPNSQNNNINNKQHLFLSPPSNTSNGSESSQQNNRRSVQSSPIVIKITNLDRSAQRRSLNYEFVQIPEKRFEDDRSAISYAEQVLQRKSILSQKKDKSQQQSFQYPVVSAFSSAPSSILKKKPLNIQTNQQPMSSSLQVLGNVQNNTKENLSSTQNVNLVSSNGVPSQEILQDGSTPEVASLGILSASGNINNSSNNSSEVSKINKKKELSWNEMTWEDRKSINKLTKQNTEKNSVVQPDGSLLGDKLGRCGQHSKRVMELYCIDNKCEKDNKLGCVLCFSSIACDHSFHQYEVISNQQDIDCQVNKIKGVAIKESTEYLSKILIKQIVANIDQFNQTLKNSMEQFIRSTSDEQLLENFNTFNKHHPFNSIKSHKGKENKNNAIKEDKRKKSSLQIQDIPNSSSNSSNVSNANNNTSKSKEPQTEKCSDEQCEDICEFLEQISSRLNKQIKNSIDICTHQQYLGEKDEEFELNKRQKLLLISKLLMMVPETTCQLFLNSDQVKYDCTKLENNNHTLHYLNDNISQGVYQLNNDSIKSGRGISFYKNGTIYEGYYKNNQYHGNGKLITFDGDVYIGQFKKNLKSGKGIMKYSNQDYYEGDFNQDQCHGQGKKYYHSDETTYIGSWNMNQKHGKGSIYQQGKVISSGIYEKDAVKPPASKQKE